MRAEVRSALLKVLIASAAAGLLACSLVVDFDPDGKPCSEDEKCLPGFECSAEQLVCVPKPPPADAGLDGGLPETDAGLPSDFDASFLDDFDAGFDDEADAGY